MPKGGKRPGAGAKKGVPQKRTVEKMELLRQQREFYAQHLSALWQARLDLALGCQYLMGKEKDGTFTRITDPDKMRTVLNSGANFYKLYAQNPDRNALKDIDDRLFGTPTQQMELSGPEGQPLSTQSDADLRARVLALVAKLDASD
jgi:hypothetical protein